MATSSTAAAADYICALIDAFAPDSPVGRKLAEWLRDNGTLAGIDFDAAAGPSARGRRRRAAPTGGALPMSHWRRLRAMAAAAVGNRTSSGDCVPANVTVLADAVGLDPLETTIFRFVLATDRDSRFNDLCDHIIGTRSVDAVGLMAAALRCTRNEVGGKLGRGPLVALQLVSIDGDFDRRFNLSVPYRVQQALLPPSEGLADIERRLIGEPLRPATEALDFGQIEPVPDFVRRLLLGALDAGSVGINLLVYGPPGTGKTEFCKSIAHQIGSALFAVGEVDEDDDEPTRGQRIDALRLAERLASRRARAILLFDEMEDILQSGDRASSGSRVRRAGSKVFFNRLLERNRVPVLWTANATDEFDPAFLRRMTFAFEMKPLPAPARARLWRQHAASHGLALGPDQATTLARRHAVAPSVIAGAARAVALAKGGAPDIEFAVSKLAAACYGHAARIVPDAQADFVPELANADSDLTALRAALTRPDSARDVSLCFYGPPGTGKSAFVRCLAQSMGLDVLSVRGSDLLSKWVGGTEQRIAAAFEEARQDGRFLVIDEAEAFLWGRGGAARAWEVSMVNEMLSAMEAHPLPFACTTNHLEAIDPAALRRFSFKVKLDFMTPAQAGVAYERFFGRDAPPALRELTALTPGDFAVVAKKLRVLGANADAAILRLLEQEIAVKNLPLQRIGF